MFLPRSLSVQSKLIAAFVPLTLGDHRRDVLDRLCQRSRQPPRGRRARAHGPAAIEVRAGPEHPQDPRATRSSACRHRAPSPTPPGTCWPRTGSSLGEPVTAEMQAEVRRFYRDEFEPALTKRAAIDPPEDSLLPTTPTGWYLHYHYIATGAEAVRRETYQSLGHRPQRLRAGRRPRPARATGRDRSARAGKPHPGGPRDPRRVLQSRTVLGPGHQPDRRSVCDEQDVETGARACAIRRTWTTTGSPISRRTTRRLAIRKPLSARPSSTVRA